MAQCAYILDNGKSCKRIAQPGSKYCWQHQSIETSLKKQSPSKSNNKLYFSLLPLDLYSPLFLYFSSSELLQLLSHLQSLPDFTRLFSYTPFWKALWRRDISTFLPLPKDAYEKYKEILDRLSKLSGIYEKIEYLAINGYDLLLKPLLSTLSDYNLVMTYAAYGGHIELVNLMLEKGANAYNNAMIEAAYRGHMNIVRLMLELGANDYNEAMSFAAKGGHIEIVRLMLEKGANNYNRAMASAAYKGHIEIVRLMLGLGANDYNEVLVIAKTKEIKDLIKSYMK